MGRKNRRDVIDESEPGSYHVYSRVVLNAFGLGVDPVTGKDRSHRKEMLLKRLELLLGIFGIECLDSSVLDTHFHLILRNRPDLVAEWSDELIAERWLRLNRAELDLRPEPTADQIAGLLADRKKFAEIRKRMSSISWLMGYLKEPLAKAFNLEDGRYGEFWGARFGCVRLKNETSLLACSLYLAMNPERAGIATGVTTSEYTSMLARLRDRQSGDPQRPESGWLAAVHVDGDGYAGAAAGRRASDKGYLGVSVDEYIELVDCLIRRERAERAGQYDHPLPPLLERLGIKSAAWEESLRRTSARFMRQLEPMLKQREEARRTVGR